MIRYPWAIPPARIPCPECQNADARRQWCPRCGGLGELRELKRQSR